MGMMVDVDRRTVAIDAPLLAGPITSAFGTLPMLLFQWPTLW
jgi:hypothetical protein